MFTLNTKAFALTCGIVWGLAVFLYTWWRILFGGTGADMTLIGYIYRGYRISAVGSLIGFVWALLDGCIGGFIFAWLYNKLHAFIK